jgi:type IV pilus assembly protein PilQ
VKYVLLIFLCFISVIEAKPLTWPQKLHDPFAQVAKSSKMELATIQLHFVDPNRLKAVLTNKKNNLISDQGFVIVQPKKKRLVIRDEAARVKKIKEIISALDQPQQQLLLKARIVSVDDEYVRDLGVLFESAVKVKSEKGAQAIANTMGNFAMPIASLGNGQVLDVRLNALEKNGHAKVISSPEIVALNHEQAVIEAGEEVPYQQETANGGTSVAFKKAVLKLQVTPHILSHQRILLDLHVNQDKVSALTVQGVPAIHTQQLQTQVELKNKQTFALGGIYEDNRSDQKQGIPFLKDIPLLGYLFKTHKRLHDKREMLVFVTVDLLS